MSNCITFKKGEDKSRLCETFSPSVRFQIPSEIRTRKYLQYLSTLFQGFIRELSDNQVNLWIADSFYIEDVSVEGGVGSIFIRDEYFDFCKIFAYDGESPRNISDWKGLWMRNHADQISRVESLYKLAEEFELFLQAKGIAYQRFGNKIEGCEICEQVTTGC